MAKFINLTPHPLTLRLIDGGETIVEPDPRGPARVEVIPGTEAGTLNRVAVYSATQWGEIGGLPAPADDVFYIVSGLVGGRVQNRNDVLVPGTGPKDGAIRNERGHIVAVTRLNMAC